MIITSIYVVQNDPKFLNKTKNFGRKQVIIQKVGIYIVHEKFNASVVHPAQPLEYVPRVSNLLHPIGSKRMSAREGESHVHKQDLLCRQQRVIACPENRENRMHLLSRRIEFQRRQPVSPIHRIVTRRTQLTSQHLNCQWEVMKSSCTTSPIAKQAASTSCWLLSRFGR